jgi:hypothetical protein
VGVAHVAVYAVVELEEGERPMESATFFDRLIIFGCLSGLMSPT